MTIGSMFYQLLISPLELFLEVVYGAAMNLFQHSGIAIFLMSMTMNVLLLPLYHRADAIQGQQRELEKSMEPVIRHIRKTFRGDERFMMLQTYYRQNSYKPYYSLRSSLPLALQVPFFIAAYHFLSHLAQLQGASLGPIRNLGAPDALLTVGGMTLNALPILMTLINAVSSAIYTKGFPRKDKLTLYGMALLFLVLLYPSPSGLVFYWTLNNLFSLGKNIVSRLKLPKPAPRARKGSGEAQSPNAVKPSYPLFLGAGVLLTVITGVLIPSAVIASSPEEFVQLADFYSPLRHVVNATLIAAGLFVVWFGVFYYLAQGRAKRIAETGLWACVGIAILDYMFFATKMGQLTSRLVYENDASLEGGAFSVISSREMIGNLLAVAVAAAAICLLYRRRRSLVALACPVLVIALVGMSLFNVANIQRAVPELREKSLEQKSEETAHFALSKRGKNVVVIMLDRAISRCIPYLFQERPELERQFSGFTYYPNTLSYGAYTNLATPALFGGYEYTPEELNRRRDEPLADKQNECLKVMPVLFLNEGYEVTVCDPPYAGYKWVPDLSIYDDYPDIHAYLTEQGQFQMLSGEDTRQSLDAVNAIWNRNFFCYSIMKVSPLCLQRHLYQSGTYFKRSTGGSQKIYSLSYAQGLNMPFVNALSALHALPDMTGIKEEGNTFLMLANSATHEPALLQEPEYLPAYIVDNTAYDAAAQDRFVCNGVVLPVESSYQMIHYQANMAAMIQIGNWLDALREQGVYDNTRIIIVSDHGRDLHQIDNFSIDDLDLMFFNPLLLVKDFNASGFRTDNTFMTNADVPTLALRDVVENPVNPFTGNPINSDAKYSAAPHVSASSDWDIRINNGTTFLPSDWYAVHDNLFDLDNWEKLESH